MISSYRFCLINNVILYMFTQKQVLLWLTGLVPRYEACKNDLTCVHNWLTDWEIDEKGENRCKNDCIPYSEMYANGTDLCETMWGDSLKVSDSSCLCLQMNEMDNEVIKLMEERMSSNSSSTRSDEEQDCHLKMDKIKQSDKVEIEGVETH